MYRFITLFLGLVSAFSDSSAQTKRAAGLCVRQAAAAPHILSIEKDTIVVAGGSTYAFTVDTPEDKGLVSTNPGIQGLLREIVSCNGTTPTYSVEDALGKSKQEGSLLSGDRLVLQGINPSQKRTYHIIVRPAALNGQLVLDRGTMTLGATAPLTLYYTAGQRSPNARVRIHIPAGIDVSMNNVTVNVIGRGDVLLKDLATQSIGRVGTNYSYSQVGKVTIERQADGSSVLHFTGLDLRPANGTDLKLVFKAVKLTKAGLYLFRASYTTASPAVLSSAGGAQESAVLSTSDRISDLSRIINNKAAYAETDLSTVQFGWTAGDAVSSLQLQQSTDGGKSWQAARGVLDAKKRIATVQALAPGKLYHFRLQVKEGRYKGVSNIASHLAGKIDIKTFGVSGSAEDDQTEAINKVIDSMHRLGGGVLLFSKGVYSVRTVHLRSNVWLFIDKDATVKALKGTDAPETTWFSDKKYRSGLSPTDPGPYADPENYLTKQDVGHHYFRNGMFFAEREDNIRIIGNGRITGDGNLVTGDRVMNNAPDNRGDKMFVFKLCTNIEIGGIQRTEDLWYDAEKDEPYYIRKDGSKDVNIDNMLQIDRGGHFVLLATGTDGIYVHNSYFSRAHNGNVRDIYDFMGCNDVRAINIYSRVSSDDIIKPGSDCSLGFTRPAKGYIVRNIIGDTNCNLFQIGSETADDITDLHVDNIYVLGANKAGFSISTNDGGHIKDVHLNCGHTGSIHSRSQMLRATAPFFISISNRGRILGADVGKYSFTENGEQHNELLVKNVTIGQVENILINGIDVREVYSGSSYGGKRWKPFDGSQKRSSPIIAGYKLPDTDQVAGKLDFRLPNGKHTGYINNIIFSDVHVLVKGGNPLSDTAQTPPELGVGQYNASNLKVQPSYGLWARHAQALTVQHCSFGYEQPDGRYAIFLDDVQGATIRNVKMVQGKENATLVKTKGSAEVVVSP